MIKLVVGLGNPGAQYLHTRHNAGAWLVNELAQKLSLVLQLQKKFRAEMAEFSQHSQRIYLVKPLTYMNESGIAVAGIAHFFQIKPEEILIVHDELDFEPGTLRFKQGGGHGGHNGIRHIMACLGSSDFYRLRLGIGHPGHKDRVVGYVLDSPSIHEKERIDAVIAAALETMPQLLSGEFKEAAAHFQTLSY